MLPRIERGEARARIAAQRVGSAFNDPREGPARALRRGSFTKRDLELTIASSFLRISIDDFRLKPVPTFADIDEVLPLPLGEMQRREAGRVLHKADDRKLWPAART